MTPFLIAGLIVVAALVVWVAIQNSHGQRRAQGVESQMSELRRDLQTMATAQAQSAGQIASIGQSVTQRLDSVTKTLQDGVSQSAQIAAQSQTSMVEQLKNSQQALGDIQKQLGAVQLAGSQMSQTAQTLQSILGGAKTRGTLGEVTLERLLEDCLPRDRYERQYRFRSGEIADAVIHLRDLMLPIDSKFPLDAYRRIAEEGEEARRAFATAVKNHADVISKKYVLPDEGTLPVALMFVPSETVYYELLMTSDAKSLPLDEYCRTKNVVAVSPNTLYAHLQVILMGLRGMQVEENAKHLQASLAGLHLQLEKFSEPFGKIGTHLKNAAQSYTESEKRLDKVEGTLGSMLGVNSAVQLELPSDESPLLPGVNKQSA
ncbi:MAG TPA: DNA recombination protein RmuC [Candidatus Dormibacteraeota bacterium]|jgi:DNA recombination protein RmuC|nr:DNA recombination protein RmuC [Candidatus Dormibacteraeota bacterium]